MAERPTTSFIYLLVFGGIAAAIEISKPLKPYVEIGLDNEAICNPSTDSTRNVDVLKKLKDSAIMVKPSHTFDSWMVYHNKHCKFKIKTAKDAGLFAVIQRMSLRREGTECLDYIKFTAENVNQKEPTVSEKFCGKLKNYNELKEYNPDIVTKEYGSQSINEEDSNDYFKNRFEASSTAGKITTEIYISKQPLRPGEVLDLLITYTPFRDCEPTASTGFIWNKRPNFKSTCINNQFNCDYFTNCVSGMCFDENNCNYTYRSMYPNEIVSDEMGTKVTVSALTSIILCFIVFVLCMWICRKHKKLCWSPDCAGPTTVSGSTTGMPMERGQQSAPNPPMVASAPMLEVAVPPSLQDKDLPPSYDSLFPSQVNTNTTTANT